MDSIIRGIVREELEKSGTKKEEPKKGVEDAQQIMDFLNKVSGLGAQPLGINANPPKKEKKKVTDPKKLLILEKGRLTRKYNTGKITDAEVQRLKEIIAVLGN